MLRFSRFLSCFLMIALLCSCAPSAPNTAPFQEETGYFRLYCEDKDKTVLKDFAQRLEERLTSIAKLLKTTPSVPYDLIYYSDMQSFHDKIPDAGENDCLYSIKSEIHFTIPDHASVNQVVSFAASEIGALMLQKSYPRASYALVCGAAACAAEANYGAAQNVAEALKNGTVPSAAQLCKTKKTQTDEMFSFGNALADYIVNTYSYDRLLSLLKKPDIRAVFEVDEDAFQQQWLDYLEQYYPTLDFYRESEHFSFYCTEADRPDADKLAETLEQNYDRITLSLKTSLPEKCRFFIYPNAKALYLIKGHQNSVGNAEYDRSIFLASPKAPDIVSSYDQMLSTAVHEFVHVNVLEISHNVPPFFNEGTAQYLSGNDEGVKIYAARTLRQSALPPFDALIRMTDEPERYVIGYLFVEYIVDQYGYDKLIELIKEFHIPSVFGINEEQFHAEWTAFVKTKYVQS